MFRVTAIRDKAAVQFPRGSWEKRVFPSRVSGRSVIYSEPEEFHMGAFSWSLSLFEGHRDVTSLHRGLGELKQNGGFLLPENFSPWTPDGRSIAIPTWKFGIFFYDVSEERISKSPIEGLVDALCWSPVESRFFLVVSHFKPTHSKLCLLSTLDGRSVQLNIQLPTEEQCRFWWLKDGSAFIGVYHDFKQSPPVIGLFDAHSGISIAKTTIDPEQFVPYDSARYRSIPRDTYSLQTSSSSWCVGYFLDTWHDWYFDCEANQLSLAVYRPAKEPIVKKQQTVLPVMESWCTLQLEF